MKKTLNCLAALALATATLPALARTPAGPRQTTPRGEEKQARADRKMERAHTIRHGESLRREPKLIRQEDKLDHRQAGKHQDKP